RAAFPEPASSVYTTHTWPAILPSAHNSGWSLPWPGTHIPTPPRSAADNPSASGNPWPISCPQHTPPCYSARSTTGLLLSPPAYSASCSTPLLHTTTHRSPG